MPIRPNFTERLVLLNLNQGPGLMLDFLGAQAFRAVCVAVKLGVFEALSGGPLRLWSRRNCRPLPAGCWMLAAATDFVIHAYSPDKNAELLRKIFGALSRGGLIIIMEQIAGKVFGISIAVSLFGLMLPEVFSLPTFVPLLAIFFPPLVIVLIVVITSLSTEVTSAIPGLSCGVRTASDCRDDD